ncbi:hypothetical protein GCM10020369_15050 [Cryptosporangium minutisporangium]|uniref:Uncharacterized protein n=1 Tax=Cryptosporangium minutisporangium TaxID=113569 RepID=A0ABP6SSP3_9ACTN
MGRFSAGGGVRGDPGAGSLPGLQVALGGQLDVRLVDHPAGTAEFGGEGAAGRKEVTGPKTAPCDRGPDRAGEAFVHRPSVLGKLEEQSGSAIGPVDRHVTGLYARTSSA